METYIHQQQDKDGYLQPEDDDNLVDVAKLTELSMTITSSLHFLLNLLSYHLQIL